VITLAVVGTRILGHRGDHDRAAARIEQAITTLRPDRVVSGGAPGVDTIAETCAIRLGYYGERLVIHRPTVHRFHGPGGYRDRDARIARECTHLLRVACTLATTYGSGWTADLADRLGKTVVRACPCPEEP
jgi:hypothetical protein